MARSFDQKKLALSQGRFRPFLDSGLAVGRFCAVEHVSVSSFYYWRIKLGLQALRRLARAIDRDARTENRGFFRPRQRGLTITTPAMKPTSMPGIASPKIRNRAVRRAMRHGRIGGIGGIGIVKLDLARGNAIKLERIAPRGDDLSSRRFL